MSSKVIQNLIKRYQQKPPKLTGDPIKVHSVVSKASFVYERVRSAVDYNEEHLVRKNAIYRILKRKLVLEKVLLENYLLDNYHQDNIAAHLMQELIRGRYLDEKTSVKAIKIVDKIIQKYNLLLSEIKERDGKISQKKLDFYLV